jgi:hypothetical protein
MINRMLKFFYFIMFYGTIISVLAIPTISLGIIGWFIGVGFIVTALFFMCLTESCIRYIVQGYWKFPLTENRGGQCEN